MKRKNDFVTNSSSVSFVIINKETINAEEFINELWDNGLKDKIKQELINSIDHKFPKYSGINEISAHNDENSLFDYIFYNFSELLDNTNNKFIIKEGYPDRFRDDRYYEENDDFKNSFPEEYHEMIEEYIKSNLK